MALTNRQLYDTRYRVNDKYITVGAANTRVSLLDVSALVGHEVVSGNVGGQVNIAKISNQVQFANPNKTSKIMLNKEILNNPAIYPNEEIMKKLFIAEIAPPKVDRTMTRQWIKIKTNR